MYLWKATCSHLSNVSQVAAIETAFVDVFMYLTMVNFLNCKRVGVPGAVINYLIYVRVQAKMINHIKKEKKKRSKL